MEQKLIKIEAKINQKSFKIVQKSFKIGVLEALGSSWAQDGQSQKDIKKARSWDVPGPPSWEPKSNKNR